jgi:selenocysteine lyase/cysteine desulfurase
MTSEPSRSVRLAREEFPFLESRVYLNTAAVALGSRRLASTYNSFINEWTADGLDYVRAERAADASRAALARIIGASPEDVALIPSVSAAAGLIAAQFTGAAPGENLVIGAQEYSSNHFPWRQLTARGYDVRQVPFRNGGIEPEDLAARVDGGTRLIALSAVQTATGHRSDLAAVAAIASSVGAWVFVDGSQSVGALDMAADLPGIDFLATSDHKFLLNAARGMGYLYVRRALRERILPLSAGWKAGAVPFESFFGPRMELSNTASRFDSSISWLAAIGDEVCLSFIEEVGPSAIYAWNRDLAATLRHALAEAGVAVLELPAANQSHIVAIPLGGRDSAPVLAGLRSSGIICSARDGNLRMSLHFYSNLADVERLVIALAGCMAHI